MIAYGRAYGPTQGDRYYIRQSFLEEISDQIRQLAAQLHRKHSQRVQRLTANVNTLQTQLQSLVEERSDDDDGDAALNTQQVADIMLKLSEFNTRLQAQQSAYATVRAEGTRTTDTVQTLTDNIDETRKKLHELQSSLQIDALLEDTDNEDDDDDDIDNHDEDDRGDEDDSKLDCATKPANNVIAKLVNGFKNLKCVLRKMKRALRKLHTDVKRLRARLKTHTNAGNALNNMQHPPQNPHVGHQGWQGSHQPFFPISTTPRPGLGPSGGGGQGQQGGQQGVSTQVPDRVVDIGTIEIHFKPEDHGVWYKLDGRQICDITVKAARENAVKLFGEGNLPNAANRMLMFATDADTIGERSADSVMLRPAHIPSHTAHGTTTQGGTHTHTAVDEIGRENDVTVGVHNHKQGWIWHNIEGASSEITTESGEHTHTIETATVGQDAEQEAITFGDPPSLRAHCFVCLL